MTDGPQLVSKPELPACPHCGERPLPLKHRFINFPPPTGSPIPYPNVLAVVPFCGKCGKVVPITVVGILPPMIETA